MNRQSLKFVSFGRRQLRARLHRACLAVLALVLAPAFGHAADYFWQLPTGNWNDPNGWTSSNPPPGPVTGVPATGPDTARVAYGQSVDINANIPSIQAIYIGADSDNGVTTGNATLNQTAGDVVLINGGHDPWMVVGAGTTSTNSIYNLSGGSLSFGGGDDLSIGQDGTGTFNLSGTGVVNVPRIQVARWADDGNVSHGAINQSGNTSLTTSLELTVGRRGIGTYTIDSGTINSIGDFNIGHADGFEPDRPANGTVTQNGGTVTVGTGVEAGGWLYVGGHDVGGTGTYNMHGGTLDSKTRIQIAHGGNSNGTFNQDGGAVLANIVEVGQGGLGSYNISAGTLSTSGNNNAVIVGAWDNGNGTMNISDAAEVTTENFLVSRSNGDPVAPPNRGVVNQTGGVVTATRDFVLGEGDPLDDGRYNLSGGVLTLGSNGMSLGRTNSTGVFTLSGGILNGNASHLDYAGPLGNFVMTGGELFNTATVNFALNQAGGIVQPSDGVGQMTVNGNYTEAVPGSLQIDIAGLGAGTGHDNLAVNGLVTLAGGLDVILGFAPTLGQTFEVLSNDSIDPIIGSFAGKPQGSTFLADFGGTPYAFQISYFGMNGNDNDVILRSVPVPEPSTIVLGTLGLLGLWGYARRRRRAA